MIFAACLYFPSYASGQNERPTPYSIAEKITLDSKILKEVRELFVYVPKGFWGMDEDLQSYPLTIVLDGESQFLNTVSAIDFLSATAQGNDKVPRSIVIGIPNTSRNRDLTPKKGMIGKDSTSLSITGGGKAFLDFITSELIPFVDEKYPTCNHRTLIGHSLGGLIVFEALLNYNSYFSNYLAIDPGFGFDNGSYLRFVMDSLKHMQIKEEKLFVAKATTLPTFLDEQSIKNDEAAIVQITRNNQKFLDFVQSENLYTNIEVRDFVDEDHFSVPYNATVEGLKSFFDYYPFQEMLDYCHPSYREQSDLVEKLKDHYRIISQNLGCAAKPLQSYIHAWAYGMQNFDRTDLALDLFDYNIELYPDQATVYESKGMFLLKIERKETAIEMLEKALSLKENSRIRSVLEDLKN